MTLSISIPYLITFLLITLRISSIVFLAPIFEDLPNGFKIFFVIAFSVSLYYYNPVKPVYTDSFIILTLMALKEFSLGFVITLILRFLVDIFFVFGEFVSSSLGLSNATILNPLMGNSTILGTYFSYFFMGLFAASSGFEYVYFILSESLKSIPLGAFDIYNMRPEFILNIFYKSFYTAFQLALPIIAIGLVMNIILAAINRLIPQINVFMVGMPIQTLIGMIFLLLIFPLLGILMHQIFEHYFKFMLEFTRGYHGFGK
jgi:Flagellar biosynthesis pathway, component FliR